jgi:hypothetical protein
MQLKSSFLLPAILLLAVAFPALAQEGGEAALAETEERTKLKKANQPFRVELTNDRGMSISSGYDFAPAPRAKLQWELLAGDQVVDRGEMMGIRLGPRQAQRISLPFSHAEKGTARSLRVRVVLEEDLPWADSGFELAWEQFSL